MKTFCPLSVSAMDFPTPLSTLSHSFSKFAVKNVTFLMQKHSQVSTTTTHVSASDSASSSHPPSSFTVEYLVKSCGLPLKSAISASRAIRIKEENIERHDSVLDLFKSYGFDDSEIALILGRSYKLLNGFKTLKPRLEFLVENGFYGPRLRELIVKNPFILGRNLNGHIKPSLEFLRTVLGTDERVWLAVKRDPRLLTNDLEGTLQPNVDLLVKEGVALDDIANLIVSHPHWMQPRVDRLVSALETVKDRLDIEPSDRLFLLAVIMIASLGVELWEKKIQVFESFGFSQEGILSIFRRYPTGFSMSEETLRAKLEFYLGTVELKIDNIISYPQMVSQAIDTRSRPRHNVLKLLLSKKLLKEDVKLARIFTISEEKFLKKYVIAHLEEIPSLLEMYNNDKLAKKIDTSSQKKDFICSHTAVSENQVSSVSTSVVKGLPFYVHHQVGKRNSLVSSPLVRRSCSTSMFWNICCKSQICWRYIQP